MPVKCSTVLNLQMYIVFKNELRSTGLYLICEHVCCVCNWNVSFTAIYKWFLSIPFSRVHKCIEWCSKSDRVSRECFYELSKLWISGFFICWHGKYLCLPDALQVRWKPWPERLVLLISFYSGLLSAERWVLNSEVRKQNKKHLQTPLFIFLIDGGKT